MGALFKSKKFWMTVVGCVAVGVGKALGADDQTLTLIGGLFGVYVGAAGLADFGKERRP